MSSNSSVSDDADGLPTLQEMAERLAELEETVETQADRINNLEQRNDVLHRQLRSVRELIHEDDMRVAEGVVGDHGGIVPMLESMNGSGSNTSVSSDVREKMLPVHRMWADVRSGASDSLGKSDRRAAVLFGAFIRRAAGESPSEETVLGYNGVDASGQKYTLSSTEAKQILEECAYIDDEKVYSQTVRRAFETVQRYTKTEECDCSTVEACGHGLVLFDANSGTNRLVTNKARFNNAMTDVVDAVEAAETGGEAAADADDSVSPEDGPDEAVGGRADVKAELDELTNPQHSEGDDD
jgi:hypothetical protein